MEEKRIGFLEGFINSFKPDRYEKIFKQKFSRSFFYLLIFTALISACLSVKVTAVLSKTASKFVEEVGLEIPEIFITEGVVSVPIEQPYIHEVENYVFIIDTTGEVVSLDDYEAGFLLTKNEIIYKDKARMKTESYDLSEVASFYITPERVKVWIKKGSKIAVPIIFVSMIVYFLAAKLIQVFLFSLVSLLVNEIKKKNLSYQELLNIGVYALTPPTILAGIVILFECRFPLFVLVYASFYIFILVLAIGKIPPKTCALPGDEAGKGEGK